MVEREEVRDEVASVFEHYARELSYADMEFIAQQQAERMRVKSAEAGDADTITAAEIEGWDQR
jgi:hypothetical protein